MSRRVLLTILLLLSAFLVMPASADPAPTASPDAALSAPPAPPDGGAPQPARAASSLPPKSQGILIGDNFPISDFADPVGRATALEAPAIAFNSSGGEYLVVWQGSQRATSTNIYAQRLDGATGAALSMSACGLSSTPPQTGMAMGRASRR